MRNEIFKEIKKSRGKYFAEMNAVNRIAPKQQPTDTRSVLPPKEKKSLKPKFSIPVFNPAEKLNKLWHLFSIIMKIHIPQSISSRSFGFRNYISEFGAKIKSKSESLKLEMAEFLLAISSDQVYVTSSTIQTKQNSFQIAAIQLKSKVQSVPVANEVFFYLSTKPAIYWNEFQQKNSLFNEPLNSYFNKLSSIKSTKYFKDFESSINKIKLVAEHLLVQLRKVVLNGYKMIITDHSTEFG